MSKTNTNISEYSALSLAYLGDAVFELMVRDLILSRGNQPVNNLHKEAKKYVSAISQSKMYNHIFERLTDEEKNIIKRGRNAKSFTIAKNASVSDYRHATGIETLFGYLHLKKEILRLEEIFIMCLETVQ